MRVKGLECLVSILKCMVEWSRDYYIDPATTGLNTVRVIRDAEKGAAPGQLGLNEADRTEPAEERGQGRHSMGTGKHGTGTAVATDGAEDLRFDVPEQFETRKQMKLKTQQGIQL